MAAQECAGSADLTNQSLTRPSAAAQTATPACPNNLGADVAGVASRGHTGAFFAAGPICHGHGPLLLSYCVVLALHSFVLWAILPGAQH